MDEPPINPPAFSQDIQPQDGGVKFPYLGLLLALFGLAALIAVSTLKPSSVLTLRARTPIVVRPSPVVEPPPRMLPPEPEINAHAYLVRIIGEDTPLLMRRAEKSLPPASLTKILTSVIALEELPPETKISFSKDAKNTEPKISDAKLNEIFRKEDVIRFAMIASANDAAVALAEAVGKQKGAHTFIDAIHNFVVLMNDKARALGLFNSSFENPTGLDQKNHRTSAEDLARLIEYIWYYHPDLWEISRTKETIVYSDSQKEHTIQNTDELLREFPAIRGSKTGLTDEAKGALILLYPVKPDKTALAVILGSENRFEDGRRIIQWIEKAFNQ